MKKNEQLFAAINYPDDLRRLEVSELRKVCDELREFLIDSVSKTGGHLGAGLGTVELAVALHYVFNTPRDKIIWDVGHQAYPHKLLTGRKDRFHTLRQFEGLSGFCKRKESEYDVFGAGHASTSISASLGIATARDFDKEDYRVVAVIGDGAMTGGMVYEAMNNCGLLHRDMTVILNDNNMSIDKNVWAFANYFSELIASPVYNRFRNNVWELTGKFDELGDRLRQFAARLEGSLKSVITPGMLFEALGFRYIGPVNGHNIVKLVHILREIKSLKGPILLHVITEKGKGYKPAEEHSQKLHGVTPFDKVTGKSSKKSNGKPSYTAVFGEALVDQVRRDPRVVGITAAMPDGTGLNMLKEEFPDHYFDVGIAEQHAVTFAGGLATENKIPVVAIYSTFLQRAFDQIIHDIALQNLHVVFALDRSGLVGADGPTHHGAFDLSYLRLIPNMVIMAPKDEQELRDMLHTAILYEKSPVAIRYPRGEGTGLPLRSHDVELEIGKGEILKEGKDVAILAIGLMVQNSMEAADKLETMGIDALVANMRFAKPLDEELLRDIFRRFHNVITIEDNAVVGGFGSAISEFMTHEHIQGVRLTTLGLPDKFIEQGSVGELHASLGLDPAEIAHTAAVLLDVEIDKEIVRA